MMNFMTILFFVVVGYLILDVFIQLFFSIAVSLRVSKALYKNRMNHKVLYDYFRPVSIIISVQDIESLQECLIEVSNLDYKQYEIILIGNSQDSFMFQNFIKEHSFTKVSRPYRKQLQTEFVERIYEGNYKNIPVTLLLKERTVRADDFNAGLNVAKYPYVLTMTDTVRIYKNALKELMRITLEEKNIAVSAGLLFPKCVKKDICTFIKYIRNTKKFVRNITFDLWNGNLFFPLSFCLIRKEVMIQSQGFSLKNGNMDASFLARIHIFLKTKKMNYRIRFVSSAIGETIENLNFQEYRSQRKEERKSFWLGLFHHKKLFFRFSYGALSFVTYTYYILLVLLKPFFLILGIVSMLYFLLLQEVSIAAVTMIGSIYTLFYIITFFFHNNEKRKLIQMNLPIEDEVVRIDSE